MGANIGRRNLGVASAAAMMFIAAGASTNARNPPLALLLVGVAILILVLGFVLYWRNRERQ
jgi:hypothetical protein